LSEADSGMLHIPSWMRSHLERHPGLMIKLEQGAMVGISHTEESPLPRPAAAVRSSIVLIPLINGDAMCGVIGLISTSEAPQLSAEEIENVRQLAHDSAPILGRLRQIDFLARQNQELARVAQRAKELEAALAKAVSERNHFNAQLKIGWHVQSNIAHELRTPLAAIRGYARMILDGRTGDVTTTQRDYLGIINDNTNRLINVANWMTHLADLSAQPFSLDICDLCTIWADSTGKNQEILKGKSLKLVERIPDESFKIVADAEKLECAFSDLITAAVNLSDSGSTITVEFSRGREQVVTVKISVSSSGVASEVLNGILDRSIHSSVTGTVLGKDEARASLNAAHEIVAMHGGRMFVNSTAGQGPTLLFTLPNVTVEEDKIHEQAVNISRR
jgi:signal transduction histidine kinase